MPLNVKYLTRIELVPYYVEALKKHLKDSDNNDFLTLNEAILAKWTISGLTYIKDHAWVQLKREQKQNISIKNNEK